MRVMTFNLRFENARDGENAWIYRREMVLSVINAYEPAVLGTQEGKWPQLMYLKEQLPEYTACLPGREPDEKSQCPTLFFRKECFEIVCGRDFWLSKTPDVHLSKDWDSAYPRMISYAKVSGIADQMEIIAGVTHLDHIGVEARYQQARIIAEWAEKQDLPFVLMGDFNAEPGSDVHQVLTRADVGLRDSWELMGGPENKSSFTHHGFDGIPQHARMDWVLVSPHFEVLDARIIHDSFKGAYPSDHYPYMVDLRISGSLP